MKTFSKARKRYVDRSLTRINSILGLLRIVQLLNIYMEADVQEKIQHGPLFEITSPFYMKL